ncbi:LysR family transcriptional regulator [Cupriavidus oxalaticus]|uniref:LysR family transcriptional regulator n=1 Tax=Cupriavidus oxalaticus TaxID=96344 RepID=A0A375GCL7_9BURK|nr:LysR family transcriptional regulator [Cupriavidus oxalaticus]QRQ86478.1 LysR family transcriptional regulator [Cupriavidus oxalaticus]QRQ95195.1 LysR family transcriptional regulator [Cupriavidus oxalaticus]WQD83852.1 LysR family transcriptional regulator [Cupriavidus oxalaticus]SPC17140.1 Transcriptional regulator LysR family [Cupriavidus oxalaticus]
MRRMCPSLTELQAFEAAARHNSFTVAARELHVTQGAISKQVRNLEAYLGTELFERVRQRLVLTDAGARYLERIGPSLNELEAATVELMARQGRGGVLHIASMPTLGAKWLIPRLPQFFARHPEVTLEFVPHAQGYDFSEPDLDAAIRFGDGVWPGSLADYMTGREVLPVCRPGLLADEPGGVARTPDALLRYPLLHHTTVPEAWPDWFATLGVTTRQAWSGARFDQFSLLTQAALSGLGIALIPRCLIEEELATGALMVAHPAQVLAKKGYYLCYPEQKQHLPALRTFRAWVMEGADLARPG